MHDTLLETLLELRVSVGSAAEASTPPWWPTKFCTEQSDSFLRPIFPRSHWAARIHTITKCAARLHDERIGVNQRVFHLFRLPESIELQLASAAALPTAESLLQPLLDNPSKATSFLVRHAVSSSQSEPGPVRVGDIDSLLSGDVVPAIAAAYSRALTNSYQAFPFVTEA